MKRFTTTIAAAAILLLSNFALASPYTPDPASLNSRPMPQWFDDAKFGIFVHWGVYSVPSWAEIGNYAEWYWYTLTTTENTLGAMLKYTKDDKLPPALKFHYKTYGRDFKYQSFKDMFKAELYDPDKWAELFKKSGAKYVIPTTKHHDGYCLWKCPDNDGWNSVDTGPKRDLIAPLAEAVRARGMRFGVYYSLLEWYHPDWNGDVSRYVDKHMFPQIQDLIARYSPGVLWVDGDWEHTYKELKSEEILAWLYNNVPNKDEFIADAKWGKDGGWGLGNTYHTTEYGAVSGAVHEKKWEEDRGIGTSFGYNRAEDITHYSSPAELIHTLAATVAHGGNFLLNVGPAADGTIPAIMQERLLQIGSWLDINAEAIYGTRPCRVASEGDAGIEYSTHKQGKYYLDNVQYTCKDTNIYAISLIWPGETLKLKAVSPGRDAIVTMLGAEGPLKWVHKDGFMSISTPSLPPDKMPCTHAFTFKITGAVQ